MLSSPLSYFISPQKNDPKLETLLEKVERLLAPVL
jgi:hypothetical protein